jgi:MinD superfamily P-loop ATPase
MVVAIHHDECKMCGAFCDPICVDLCPTTALRVRDCKVIVNDFLCEDCNECGFACPDKAIEIKEVTW